MEVLIPAILRERLPPLRCDTLLTQLFLELLKFYSTFSYSTEVVCPLDGHSLLRYSVEHRVFLPPSLTRNSFLNTDDKDRLQIWNRPLSVQDPIELTRSVGQSVSRSQLKVLIKLCTHGVNPINLFGRRKVGVKLWMLFELKL